MIRFAEYELEVAGGRCATRPLSPDPLTVDPKAIGWSGSPLLVKPEINRGTWRLPPRADVDGREWVTGLLRRLPVELNGFS